MKVKLPPKDMALWFESNVIELKMLDREIEKMYAARKKLINNLTLVADAFKRLRDEVPDISLPNLELPPELAANPRYAVTVGDSVEALLKQHGPMSRKDILRLVQESGVKISENNPFVVLSNAIKRDPKNRFVTLKNRKVDLRKE